MSINRNLARLVVDATGAISTTNLGNAPLTAEQKEAWSTYRQALRDITSQAGFPDSVVFPTAP